MTSRTHCKCPFKKGKTIFVLFLFMAVFLLGLFINLPRLELPFETSDISAKEMQSNETFMSWRIKLDQKLQNKLERHGEDLKYSNGNYSIDWSIHDTELFVYSAFVDQIARSYNNNIVKVVSFVRKHYSRDNTLKCALMFSNNKNITVNAKLYVLPHPQNFRTVFNGAYVLCPYSSSNIPTQVSLSWKTNFSNWTSVQMNKMKEIENTSIVICVRPLFNEFISIISLAEFISFYEANGVEKFVFYNYNAPSAVLTYLNLLIIQNYSIEVLPWAIPFEVNDGTIHQYGQIVQTQDCILRHRYKYKYVINVDLDEFIVPRIHRNLKFFIQQMTIQNPNAGSFVVPNVFFCTEFIPPNLRPPVSGLPLLSTNAIWRQRTIWEARYRIRTKWIILPERVNIGDIHDIIEHVQPFTLVDVSPSVVLLHHHRGCGDGTQIKMPSYVQFKMAEDIVEEDTDLILYKDKMDSSVALLVLYNFL